MIQPSDYEDFYSILFEPIESEYGTMDSESIIALIGFDMGGPLNLSKIEKKNLYVSCELCCRDDQIASSFGNYELMVIGPNTEEWARTILTDIARMSLDTQFDHHHTLDITAWVDPGSSIHGVIFEEYSSLAYKGKNYGLMRVIGITKQELTYCYENSTIECIERLKKTSIYPKTILDRRST